MKVLFFIHSLVGGGAERVLINLSNELIKKGHDVSVCLNEKNIAYNLNNNISLYCYNYGERKRPSILQHFYNNVHKFKYTRKVIRTVKPDVIVASWGSHLLHILLNHGNIPVVSSEHNTFDRKHGFQDYVRRFYLNKFCDKVAVLTKYDKAYMARKLTNTVVVPNPLSFSPIEADEYDATFKDRKNILACGRLNAHHVKGFDILIESFAQIAHLYPEWDLDIAGTGINGKKDEEYLYSLAVKNGVEGRVHLIGFHSDMAKVMKGHSIFALSSRSEGFGMVLTEAMAMGCACVSFNLTGPGEIIVDGIDGVLVENQNVKSFANALSTMIEDEEMRKSMGMRAIEDVKRFCAPKITDLWVVLFDNVRQR